MGEEVQHRALMVDLLLKGLEPEEVVAAAQKEYARKFELRDVVALKLALSLGVRKPHELSDELLHNLARNYRSAKTTKRKIAAVAAEPAEPAQTKLPRGLKQYADVIQAFIAGTGARVVIDDKKGARIEYP